MWSLLTASRYINQLMIRSLFRFLALVPGWHTKRHIVVIESDDWGSIRMPSKEVYEQLLYDGFDVDKDLFSKYDSLERGEDLSSLFEVLQSVKDKNGNPAIMTANSVVVNPDFDKVEADGFATYHYELTTETYKHQPGCENSHVLIQQGMSEKVWQPQLHGREHLNVIRWMKALQSEDEITRLCFGQRHFSLTKASSPKVKARFMDAFANAAPESLKYETAILQEAADLFEKQYGFRSKSFIAPCYIWKRELEPVMKECGIDYLQGLSLQQIPVNDEPLKYKSKYHYLGQKNKLGQTYLVRNAFFEPYKGGAVDWTDECLKRVEIAFNCHKPAIISTHRLNFIGALDVAFRDNNLKKLEALLLNITKHWPDVEFMSSDQLGDVINGK